MTPSRYQDWGASLGGGFDVADETLDRPAGFDLDDDIDDDFEANLEAEALTKGFGGIGAMGLDVTVLTAFGSQGFNTTPQFRKTWIALLRANRVRSSAGFRADFCKARHFRAKLKGAGIKTFAVVRGFPMAYSFSVSGKVILEGIGNPRFIDQLARSGQRTPPLSAAAHPIAETAGIRGDGVLLASRLRQCKGERTAEAFRLVLGTAAVRTGEDQAGSIDDCPRGLREHDATSGGEQAPIGAPRGPGEERVDGDHRSGRKVHALPMGRVEGEDT
jgi:hypothetical protein